MKYLGLSYPGGVDWVVSDYNEPSLELVIAFGTENDNTYSDRFRYAKFSTFSSNLD